MAAKKPDPLKFMEDAAPAIEALTGLRAQFVALGWDETNAEQAVVEMLRSVNIAAEKRVLQSRRMMGGLFP